MCVGGVKPGIELEAEAAEGVPGMGVDAGPSRGATPGMGFDAGVATGAPGMGFDAGVGALGDVPTRSARSSRPWKLVTQTGSLSPSNTTYCQFPSTISLGSAQNEGDTATDEQSGERVRELNRRRRDRALRDGAGASGEEHEGQRVEAH